MSVKIKCEICDYLPLIVKDKKAAISIIEGIGPLYDSFWLFEVLKENNLITFEYSENLKERIKQICECVRKGRGVDLILPHYLELHKE